MGTRRRKYERGREERREGNNEGKKMEGPREGSVRESKLTYRHG